MSSHKKNLQNLMTCLNTTLIKSALPCILDNRLLECNQFSLKADPTKKTKKCFTIFFGNYSKNKIANGKPIIFRFCVPNPHRIYTVPIKTALYYKSAKILQRKLNNTTIDAKFGFLYAFIFPNCIELP
jgi:hypothetical protein